MWRISPTGWTFEALAAAAEPQAELVEQSERAAPYEACRADRSTDIPDSDEIGRPQRVAMKRCLIYGVSRRDSYQTTLTRSSFVWHWHPHTSRAVTPDLDGTLKLSNLEVRRLMDDELRVWLSEEGADAERLDDLTILLRSELLGLDVEDVTRLRNGAAPPGSKALDMVSVSALLVTIGSSAKGLFSVIQAIRDWLARSASARRSVRLELGDDVLELSAASEADQDRLITLFVERHAAKQD